MINVLYKKILVVDDEEELRKNITRMLKILGFITDQASNGEDAYKKILENDYDLVISDIKMPVMDGYTLLDKIRKNEDKRNVQFIFLTSNINTGDIRSGMILGADDYITKPFENEQLALSIKKRLERAGELSEFYKKKFSTVIKENV